MFKAVLGAVVATPDVLFVVPDPGIRWLVLGSDGLWDYFPLSKKLASVVDRGSDDGRSSSRDMAAHVLKAIRKNHSVRSPDNVTILVIKLKLENSE